MNPALGALCVYLTLVALTFVVYVEVNTLAAHVCIRPEPVTWEDCTKGACSVLHEAVVCLSR